jgi:sigma-B regulation protein RsbU (phosphoserine phosphatase)
MKRLKQHVTVKSITGIVALLVLFSVIVSIIGYRTFTNALLNQYAEGAFLTAQTAAELVDADRMDEYAQSGGTTPEYLAVWNRLDHLCNTSGSTFIYVIEPDRSDYGHITFLFSTIDHDSPYTKYDFGFLRETTNDEYRAKYRALYELATDRELVIRDKGNIETDSHITAMMGLKGSDGQVKGILCVQRQMDILTGVRNTFLNKVALAMIGLMLLVIIGQSVYLHRVLLQPLNLITEEAARFSAENKAAEHKLQESIRNRDEIGKLAASVDRMEEQIETYIADITQITAERERISTELSLATRIQAAFIPHLFPPFPDRPEFALYATMDPAKEVGGDFYDFFLIDEDHLGLVMADVSGKGVPAALFMMASKIILQSCAMLGQGPAAILTKTNEAICSNNQEGMFVTVWLGILEISTGKLRAANAGHEYPVLKPADGDFALLKDKHGFVIGGMSGVRYREYELQLTPGAKLFVYTDGVPEASNARNELFGTERMLSALNERADGTPEDILATVRRAVDGFVQEAEQFDDLTMLCLEYRGPQAAPARELTVDAAVENIPAVTAFVEAQLDAVDCSPKARGQLSMAIDEIVANIAQYAYAPEVGPVTVRFAFDEGTRTATLTFLDKGLPYNPLEKADPDVSLSAEDRPIGGLGIFLVKKTMDGMAYAYKHGQNVLTIQKRL